MQRSYRSAGAATAVALQSGSWYRFPAVATLTAVAQAAGSLRVAPKYIPNAVTLDRLGAEVSVTGDAGSLVRLGIYADDGTGKPGALMLDAGTILGDSATVQSITISKALTAGWYWFGAVTQNITVTPPTVRSATALIEPVVVAYSAAPAANTPAVGYSTSGVTGALPATFGTPATTTAVPAVFGRIA